jgi:hypothetical protein
MSDRIEWIRELLTCVSTFAPGPLPLPVALFSSDLHHHRHAAQPDLAASCYGLLFSITRAPCRSSISLRV